MNIGWGIVSAGRHSDIKVVSAIKQAKDAEVIAVYSCDMKRAEAFGQKYDPPGAYGSIEALVNDPEIARFLFLRRMRCMPDMPSRQPRRENMLWSKNRWQRR